MKLKSKLMLFTAAAALSANMAFAAIDPQALAEAYVAEGYTYVEVKVGPTQTKLEGVKGDRKVEVIYDNASGTVIKQEFEAVDDDYAGRTGIEIDDADDDFEDLQDDDESDDDEDDDSDDDEDDDSDDDEDDDSGDDESDDNGGDDESDDDDEGDSGNDDEGDRGDDDEGNESGGKEG